MNRLILLLALGLAAWAPATLSAAELQPFVASHVAHNAGKPAGSATMRVARTPEARQCAIALQDGDMSGLLINLAILRDAAPGRSLHYRFVDGGRVREHGYVVSPEVETVVVGKLSYEALRVSRSNAGNDETILWVADGVPSPVRILQRQDGEDGIDLRLTGYQGVQ